MTGSDDGALNVTVATAVADDSLIVTSPMLIVGNASSSVIVTTAVPSTTDTPGVVDETWMTTVSFGSTTASPATVMGIDARVAPAGTLTTPLIGATTSLPTDAVPPAITVQFNVTAPVDAGARLIGTLATWLPVLPSTTVRSPIVTIVFGAAAASSSTMENVAAESPSKPAPVTPVNETRIVSGASTAESPMTEMGTDATRSPGANVTLPLMAAKSVPAVAVPAETV